MAPTSSDFRSAFEVDRRELGQAGERLAADHLCAKGYRIVERNRRTATGEIDLIVTAPDGTLVFVEVRTRRGAATGELTAADQAAASIDRRKQQRLWDLAEEYLGERELTGDARIDVVAVALGHDGRLIEVRHYENAVQGA